MPKSNKRRSTFDASLVIADAPLARRNKEETKAREKLEKFTKQVNFEAWNKAVELVDGDWNPFPKGSHIRTCYSSKPYQNHQGFGVLRRLLQELKRAVLCRNWENAVKLADAIFGNFESFQDMIHVKVLLSVIMNHPKANGRIYSDLCSFVWKMEDKAAMTGLMTCFCSMPKTLPTEYVYEKKNKLFRRTPIGQPRSELDIRYTAHIGICEDNDMYVS